MRRLALALVLAVIASSAAACQVRLPGAPGCPIFPDDNIWHADVSKLPVDPRSGSYVAAIGESAPLKADFGSGLWDGGPIGIPYAVVGAATPKVARRLRLRRRERRRALPDPARTSPIEGGAQRDGDRHVLARRQGLVHALRAVRGLPATATARWHAGSGAIWDLKSNALRPDGLDLGRRGRAADPARARALRRGRGGHDHHAIRVTRRDTQARYVWPARHVASSRHRPSLPPMGLRFRLKPGVDITGYPPEPA